MEANTKMNTVMPVNGPIEKIIPVFFGENSALYGCYHNTDESHDASAVLICQPIGHEYERSHRAMRQLAVQLAKKGAATMRFDYFGAGDSAGSSEETTLDRMREDIREAIVECEKRSRAEHLTLIGLRLGATLAAQAAGSHDNIEALVLYAPVLDGELLFDEWQNAQRAFNNKHSHTSMQNNKGEILGFPVTERFRNDLAKQFTLELSNPLLKRVLILVDEADIGSRPLNNWVGNFESGGAKVTVESVENIAIWRREPNEAVVPIKTIRRIVKWISEN